MFKTSQIIDGQLLALHSNPLAAMCKELKESLEDERGTELVEALQAEGVSAVLTITVEPSDAAFERLNVGDALIAASGGLQKCA